ncbi:MAG: FixH family protein [Gammaproteobacteria bacterium]|nr:FixH family protein [Gammaproteobacteria bacterium]
MSNSEPFFSQSSKQALRNPWVIGWLGILLLVLIVNAAFIITAFMTNPGLVEKDYYEKGQDYEKTIRTRMANKKRLAWDIDIKYPAQLIMDRATTIHVNILDKEGHPLDAHNVVLSAYRPSDAQADFSHEMINISSGRFVVTVKFPLKGVWDIKATVRANEDSLDIQHRIHVTG